MTRLHDPDNQFECLDCQDRYRYCACPTKQAGALRAENNKLRAIAKAASVFNDDQVNGMPCACEWCAIKKDWSRCMAHAKLREAFAALPGSSAWREDGQK